MSKTLFPYLKKDTPKLTHSQLVDLAGRYLQRKLYCKMVFQECSTIERVFDAIGYQSNTGYMIEVKVSRADFFADRKKKHFGNPSANKHFYLVPAGLVEEKDLPEGYGLLYAHSDKLSGIEQVVYGKWHVGGVDEQLKSMLMYQACNKMGVTGRFNSKGKIT